MTVALIDSGLGLLSTTGWLRHLAPELDLLLLLDPDGAPWGSRTASFVTDRLFTAAQLAVQRGAEAIVVPCNTATVTAIDALRERFEPRVPVIGTVPAVKPAAATGQGIAVWATVRTTSSDYQDRLIADFANGRPVARVACPGLAEAIDHGDMAAATEAIADAAERTPKNATPWCWDARTTPWWRRRFCRACPPEPPCTTARRRSPAKHCGDWTEPGTRTAPWAPSTWYSAVAAKPPNRRPRLPGGPRPRHRSAGTPRNSHLRRNSLPDGCTGDLTKPRIPCTFSVRRTTTPFATGLPTAPICAVA